MGRFRLTTPVSYTHLDVYKRQGVSTLELDSLAVETMSKYNATSCFLGYRGFPAHICASINEELVHGIPKADRVLQEGDIISIDVGVRYRGFIGEMCIRDRC